MKTTKGMKLYNKLYKDTEKNIDFKSKTKAGHAFAMLFAIQPIMIERLKNLSDEEFDKIVGKRNVKQS